mmetsp:Transcript_24903/g.41087  ORF Transcript_24903/g.41087 Transcript_24903/m.41087 type:complete len:187 (+) Transcript_24903:68-628(+)
MKRIQSLSTSLVIWAIACITIPGANCFTVVSSGSRSLTRLSAEDENKVNDKPPASVTMDDGGSDLTDRFKYKVHALMGTYDLPEGKIDDENQMGNIIGAMLNFPAEYTFSVVGKKAETEDPCDNYERKVRAVIESVLGESATMEMRVTPRGKKYTKVSVKLSVESAAIISTIYDELGALKDTVMKF